MTNKPRKLAIFALWMLAVPLPASAIVTFTFDQANQTVVRPTSGSVNVFFSGTLTKDDSDTLQVFTIFTPFNLAGDSLTPTFAGTVSDLGDADRFFFVIDAATPLGLYDLDFLASPVTFVVGYLDATGASRSVATTYSIDVVVSTVAEPATLALLGIGLAGFATVRRRKQ